MRNFLFVYDRRTRTRLVSREYAHSDRARALTDSLAYELEYRKNPDIEVVVLGAESEAALRKTHARYFMTPEEFIRQNMP